MASSIPSVLSGKGESVVSGAVGSSSTNSGSSISGTGGGANIGSGTAGINMASIIASSGGNSHNQKIISESFFDLLLNEAVLIVYGFPQSKIEFLDDSDDDDDDDDVASFQYKKKIVVPKSKKSKSISSSSPSSETLTPLSKSSLISSQSALLSAHHQIHIDHEHGFFKMENIGFEVGQRLTERLTKDKPRFTESLEIIKFICKEYWIFIFKKPIDNLKTNHRGIYVLTDNSFKYFARLSSDTNSVDTARESIPFLAFPCGLIRGALFALGIPASVSAEIVALPQCIFQIKILG